MLAVTNLRLFAIALIASASCFFSSCGEKETPETETATKAANGVAAEACRNSASYLGASVIVRQKLQTKKHQLQNSHCLQSLTLYRLAHQLGGIFFEIDDLPYPVAFFSETVRMSGSILPIYSLSMSQSDRYIAST